MPFKSHYMNPPLVYNPYISSSGKTEINFVPQFKSCVITNEIKTEAPTLWPGTLVSWPAPLCSVLLPPYSPAKNALLQQRNRAEQLCVHASSEMGLLSCREVREKRLYEAGEQKRSRHHFVLHSPLENEALWVTVPAPQPQEWKITKKRDHQFHPFPKFLCSQV